MGNSQQFFKGTSDKLPRVMSLESIIVGSEDCKFENGKKGRKRPHRISVAHSLFPLEATLQQKLQFKYWRSRCIVGNVVLTRRKQYNSDFDAFFLSLSA